jgi:predicted O-methyltransferase YrrM
MQDTKPYVRMLAQSDREILLALGLQPPTRPTPAWFASASSEWSLEPELVKVLLALVEQIRPAVVVELGTYMGRTAAALGCLLRDLQAGHLFTVDDFRSIDSVQSRTLFQELSLESVITQIAKTTIEAFDEWGRAPIDVLIIDAAHDYVSSCIDFALWSRFVPSDGWIVIHDTRTRLLRRFPEDYLHPLSSYDVLEVVDLWQRASARRPWEGVAFVRYRDRARRPSGLHPIDSVEGSVSWAGSIAQ